MVSCNCNAVLSFVTKGYLNGKNSLQIHKSLVMNPGHTPMLLCSARSILPVCGINWKCGFGEMPHTKRLNVNKGGPHSRLTGVCFLPSSDIIMGLLNARLLACCADFDHYHSLHDLHCYQQSILRAYFCLNSTVLKGNNGTLSVCHRLVNASSATKPAVYL